MKKVYFLISTLLLSSSFALAQANVSPDGSAKAVVTADSDNSVQVSGKLQTAIDAKKANIGDEVVLKTSKTVRLNGETIIEKGSKVFGRVTEVQRKSKANAGSSVTILFDRVEQNGKAIQIQAMISSVFEVQSSSDVPRYESESSFDKVASSQPPSTSGGGRMIISNNGSPVLGPTSIVGDDTIPGNPVAGVVKTMERTPIDRRYPVKSIVTAQGADAGNVKGMSIANSTSFLDQSGSSLIITKGNLGLESGTTFNLILKVVASK